MIQRAAFKKWMTNLLNEPPKLTFNRMQVKLGLKNYTNFESYVWCLSTGRVGTKTISKLLDIDSSILSLHEPSPKLFGLSKIGYDNISEEALLQAVLACRSETIGVSQKTYMESSPHLTFLARMLQKGFKNSKFIHIVRHPRKVVDSGVKRNWYSGNRTDEWRIEPSENDQYYSKWQSMDSIEKNIWSWVRTNEWILDFQLSQPQDDFLTIRSEDLFSGQKDTIERLFKFCGVDDFSEQKVNKVLSKRINSNMSNGITAGKIVWKQKHIDLLNHMGRELILKFNYNLDF